MQIMNCNYEIDVTSMECPKHKAEIKKIILEMNAGETLYVKSIDPSLPLDLRVMAKRMNFEISKLPSEGNLIELVLKKN